MAEEEGMAVDTTSPTTDDLGQLRARVEELQQLQIDAEQAAHDSANRIAYLEQQLQSKGQSQAQDDAHRGEVERLQAELQARDRAAEDGKASSRKVEEVEKEKRELLSVIERLEGDKGELEASLQSLRNTHSITLASLRQVETSLSTSTDQERSARLKLQTAEGELEIVKRDRDWHRQELEKGEREWKSWREDKHAQVVRLQTALESAESLSASSSTALERLRASSEANESRLTEAQSRVAELTSRVAEQEFSFRTEIDAQKRLVELLERREAESAARLGEVEREWTSSQALTESKAIEWEAAVAAERSRADNLAHELETSRTQADQSMRYQNESDIFAPPSRAGTPGLPASPGGPAFALSPSASMAARLQKGGRSYTEVYSEYVRVQDELTTERAEVKRLSECLTSILADIEERAPLFREQRAEYERVTEENNGLAGQLARALEERDANDRRANGYRLDAEGAKRENEIINHQLSDLGRQVRALSRTLARLEDPSIASRSNDAEDVDMQDAQGALDDTIPTDLLTFTSISQLVQRNQTLLRITRELSARMDARDEEAIRRLERTENEAVKEAHDTILALKDELERQRTQMEAGTREREMLRRLVSQRGGGGSTSGMNGHAPPMSGRDESIARELADVQLAFEAYKTESTLNAQRSSEDVTTARREAATAAVASAKANAQIDFLNERLRTLNDREEQKNSELAQLTKNIASLKKASAQQEQSVHEYSQQLIIARGSVDKLEHEISNLRAEREVWKGTEARLVATNESLSSERGQLNDLLRTLQSMQNELESTGAAARRRLEADVAKLEAQLSDVRDKLNSETDAHKQLALRREVDTKTLQDRLDRLSSDYAAAREEVLTTKNALEQSQNKLDESSRHLAATEAKLAVYTDTSGATGDPRLSREQQLQVELADVRAELQTAKVEADQARAHVEQFKRISQANEDALANITSTSDEYKSTTDKTLAEREAAVASLTEQVKVLSTEIESLNDTATALRRQVEEAKSSGSDELRQLQQTITEMREAHAQRATENASMRDSLRQAEQRATDAHDKYERELVAHAEDVKSLTIIKEQLGELRSSSFAAQTASDTASAKLESANASWQRQREALQRDLDDTRDRLQAALSQNSTLHEHLEQVNATASKIRQTSNADADMVDGEAPAGEGGDKLQDIIRYLRREQEILNLQLHLDRQEKARLTQKLEHTERGLDEARASLTAERQRSGENTASAAQHAELLEKVNTLNVLRESNATLREDSEANARKAATLESRLREVEQRDETLRKRVGELEAELQTREVTIKIVEEDAARWKARTTQILEKYERIDPAEHQSLKERVATLEQDNAELQAKTRDTEALNAVQAELEQQKARVTELEAADQAKALEIEQAHKARDEAKDRFQRIQGQARAQRDRAQALQGEVEVVRQQLSEAEERAANETAAGSDRLAAEKAKWEEERTKLVADAASAAAPAETSSTSAAELSAAQEQLAAAQSRATDLERQLQEAQKSISEAASAAPAPSLSADEIEAEVQRRLASASVTEDTSTLTDEERQQRTEAVQAALQQEREQAIEAARAALRAELEAERNAAVEQRATSLRSEAERNLAELTERLTAEATEREKAAARQHEEALKQIRQQSKQQIQLTKANASKEHNAELEKIKAEHAAALQTAKAEASTAAAPADANVDAIVAEKLAAKEAELKAALAAKDAEITALQSQAKMDETKIKMQQSRLNQLNTKKPANGAAGGTLATPALPPVPKAKATSTAAAQSPPPSATGSPVPSTSRTPAASTSGEGFTIAGRATGTPASPTPIPTGPASAAGRGRGAGAARGGPTPRGRRAINPATALLSNALGAATEQGASPGPPTPPVPGGTAKRPHAGSDGDVSGGGEGGEAKRQKGA